MKERIAALATISLLIAMGLSGCVRLALRLSPSWITGMSEALFEECDPRLAESSLPAQLKLLEGLLRQDPDNRRLLTTLSMGLTGYALLFVQEQDPDRASRLYSRARDIGLRALGLQEDWRAIPQGLPEALGTRGKTDFEALFWTTVSWNGWIALNLDQPSALAQAGIAWQLLERALAIQPAFFHGTLYILKGSILTARAALGDAGLEEARKCFERALALSQHRFFMAQVYYAGFYAVRVQDKALFTRLTEEVRAAPETVPDPACLINTVMRERANRLSASLKELFY